MFCNESKLYSQALKKAASQTAAGNEWIKTLHGDILGRDFHFVRVIALPNQRRDVIMKLQIDQQSLNFILTKDELDNPSKMKIWWKKNISHMTHKKVEY